MAAYVHALMRCRPTSPHPASLPSSLQDTVEIDRTIVATWHNLARLELWSSWRAAVTYYVFLRILFPLTSASFIPFQIPALDKLLSRTSPTGFDNHGRAVPLNVKGLSAYVSWLERFLSRPKTLKA